MLEDKAMYSYIRSSLAPHITELHFSNKLPSPDLVSSVRIFVFDQNGHLLFIQESDGKWDLPGGGKEGNETPEQAAMREVFEESGVRIKNINWIAFEKLIVNGEKPIDYKRHFPVTYFAYATAEVESIEPFIANNEVIARSFMPSNEAIEQDGILFGTRHVILDKIIERFTK